MTLTHPVAPPTTPRGAASPPSTVGRVLTAVGVAVAVVLLALGATHLLSSVFSRSSSTTQTLAAGDVVELVADGDVEVVAADVDDLRVGRTAVYAWAEPRYEVTVAGDRTVVRHECSSFWSMRCSASLTVRVPEGTRVVVRSVDGVVRVDGAAGDLDLRAADGDVTVGGAQGDVTLHTVDGDVSVGGVLGDVDLHVSDGDLRVADVGGDARASTRDGHAWLSGVAGDVEARTTDGSLDVRDVRGSVTARSVDGDVQVAAVRGDVTVRTVDGDLTVRGTGEPVALTVSSMGRQRIDAPTDPDADVRVDLRSTDGTVAYLGPEG